jgi:hypothetical protein
MISSHCEEERSDDEAISCKTAISLRSLRRGFSQKFDRSVLIVVSILLARYPDDLGPGTQKDVSGYTACFTAADVSEILLATYVGNQTLTHWHGCPLRAVVLPGMVGTG